MELVGSSWCPLPSVFLTLGGGGGGGGLMLLDVELTTTDGGGGGGGCGCCGPGALVIAWTLCCTLALIWAGDMSTVSPLPLGMPCWGGGGGGGGGDCCCCWGGGGRGHQPFRTRMALRTSACSSAVRSLTATSPGLVDPVGSDGGDLGR